MRILIVNGYGNDEKSKLSFVEFQVQILKICSDQKELVDTEIECFYRDKNNLDDYLYDVQTGHIKKEYAYNFDHIDMIFICGNSNIRPWDIKMNKILTLIKMCSKSQKNLYVCGFGLYCLVYLYASNIERQIKIINGDGNGGKLSEMNDLQNKLYYIQPDEYFLDNTTGDLYGYSNQSDEWIPKGNVGIHNRKNAQEFQSFGKFVIKAPTYKVNLRHLKQQLQYNSFKQRFYEDQCIIKKMYCQEKIFEDIQSEFLCPLISTWDVHTFLFTNPQKSFEVLAESNLRGPLIIRSKNILGSAFPVDNKYPETVPGKMSQQPVNQQNKQHKIQNHSNTYYNSLQKKKLHQFKNDSLSQGMIKRPDQSGTLFSPMYNSFMFVGVPHQSQDQIQKEYQKQIQEKLQTIHKNQLSAEDQIDLLVKEALDLANQEHKCIYWVDETLKYDKKPEQKYINLRVKNEWEILFEPLKKQNKPVVSQKFGCYCSRLGGIQGMYKHEPGNCNCEIIFKKYYKKIEKIQQNVKKE
ncbi:hypothetical protein PPERSA_04317 [Pseudocohnilembus persalinus]|uniref:Glutamine amidotransferase domain-containing protein n=1 Tax=Pseudocohnilembus persalinus TaxID=266149 RepID=A0A0V0QQI2_PSEPJ|nr:hypothetical protein PPERSA_04317 [Pseudocohnilembus persalinus]|eukprot:KRX04502.1 hypothetical protein PPERSA_04317 [Pseudocohnilembus persalinus]